MHILDTHQGVIFKRWRVCSIKKNVLICEYFILQGPKLLLAKAHIILPQLMSPFSAPAPPKMHLIYMLPPLELSFLYSDTPTNSATNSVQKSLKVQMRLILPQFECSYRVKASLVPCSDEANTKLFGLHDKYYVVGVILCTSP